MDYFLLLPNEILDKILNDNGFDWFDILNMAVICNRWQTIIMCRLTKTYWKNIKDNIPSYSELLEEIFSCRECGIREYSTVSHKDGLCKLCRGDLDKEFEELEGYYCTDCGITSFDNKNKCNPCKFTRVHARE